VRIAMIEAFKIGFAGGLGVLAAAFVGLAALGLFDWIGYLITKIRLAWRYQGPGAGL